MIKIAAIDKSEKPQHCGKKMQRLYIRKGTKNRKWIPVGYYCNLCSKVIKNRELVLYQSIEELRSRQELVDNVTNKQKIVLDIGDKLTKVGFAGEKEPRFIFDTRLYIDQNNKSFIQKADKIETSRKVKHQKSLLEGNGEQIVNSDDMVLFLTHVFEKLGTKPQNKSIMLIEKSYKNNYVEYYYGRHEEIKETTLPEEIKERLSNKPKIEKVNYDKYIKYPRRELASIFFDYFDIARIYFSNGELLSLYSNAMVTGLVVNIGVRTTRIIPVFQGFIVTQAISTREFGTEDVEKRIHEHLNTQKNVQGNSEHIKYLIEKQLRLASEEYCYISLDPSIEQEKWSENAKLIKHINLFNDNYVKLDQIRYLATEILFEKEEMSTSTRKGNLVDAAIETIQKANIDLEKDLYENILLTGGGTFYKGFKERFQTELETKAPESLEVNVRLKPNRLISSWIGGSILSNLKTFETKNLWVTKDEYEERGSSAVDRCI